MKTTDPIPGFGPSLFRVGQRRFLGLATVLLFVFALDTTALAESTGLFALTVVASGLLLVVGANTISGSSASDVFSPRRRCVECGEEASFKTPHGIMCLDHTRRALDADSELWLPRRLDEEGEPDDEGKRDGKSSATQDL